MKRFDGSAQDKKPPSDQTLSLEMSCISLRRNRVAVACSGHCNCSVTPDMRNDSYGVSLKRSKNPPAGVTLVETMVAVALVAVFFVSIFEVNGLCLRYIKSSKNNVAALQGVQDRLEQLRNMSFANLTSASSVQSLMVTPANGSEFLARSPTEVVTLSAYPTPDASNTQITLSAGASSANMNSTDSNLANAKLVKINVTYTWTETFGGRSRSEQSETIVSAGTKK